MSRSGRTRCVTRSLPPGMTPAAGEFIEMTVQLVADGEVSPYWSRTPRRATR